MAIQRQEGFVHVPDGEDIWYESAGSGPAMILSHGLSGNAAGWFQQFPHFAQDHQVIIWDQRGFGRSTNRTGGHGVDAAISDQLAILDHLEIETIDLVGHSMGGFSAVGVALARPERVRTLVLACTTAGLPRTTPPQPTNRPPQTTPLPLGVHPALAKKFASANPELSYLFQTLGTFGDRPPNDEFRAMMASYEFAESSLTALSMPMMFLCGEIDPIAPPAAVRDVAQRFPAAPIVQIPGAGHSVYYEQPQAWNRVVGDFLRDPHPAS